MRKFYTLYITLLSGVIFAQQSQLLYSSNGDLSDKTEVSNQVDKPNYVIPNLIPKRVNGKLGFVDKKGKTIVKPQYDFGGFFYEDCNLLNSPNANVRKFGTSKYASVTLGEEDFRIDNLGKRVYKFKPEDLGTCSREYSPRSFYAYTYRGFYGLVNNRNFDTPNISSSFTIYPQYDYLFVMESEDPENPMMIVSRHDKFGVVNKNNEIILPLEYDDIKRNFSWKIAHMFEVTKDGKNYFFVDSTNTAY